MPHSDASRRDGKASHLAPRETGDKNKLAFHSMSGDLQKLDSAAWADRPAARAAGEAL